MTYWTLIVEYQLIELTRMSSTRSSPAGCRGIFQYAVVLRLSHDAAATTSCISLCLGQAQPDGLIAHLVPMKGTLRLVNEQRVAICMSATILSSLR